MVAGTLICSGCLDDFVADGLDFAKMDDKYNAVEYKPFNQRILKRSPYLDILRWV